MFIHQPFLPHRAICSFFSPANYIINFTNTILYMSISNLFAPMGVYFVIDNTFCTFQHKITMHVNFMLLKCDENIRSYFLNL